MKVILESPYGSKSKKVIGRNIQYARLCMADCFNRNELPFASHLLYPQKGVLDDSNPKERELGIRAGLEWGKHAEKTVVYTDLGISEGMKLGIISAEKNGRPVEYRKISKAIF